MKIIRDLKMSVGEAILIKIFSGSENTYDELRYNIYNKKLATSRVALTPEMLAPTSDAAILHTLHV